MQLPESYGMILKKEVSVVGKIKKLFPMAFTVKSDLTSLIVDLILHLFFGFTVYIIGDLLTSLGTFGIVLAVISVLIDLYLAASAVFAVLNYCKVIE